MTIGPLIEDSKKSPKNNKILLRKKIRDVQRIKSIGNERKREKREGRKKNWKTEKMTKNNKIKIKNRRKKNIIIISTRTSNLFSSNNEYRIILNCPKY